MTILDLPTKMPITQRICV